MYQIMRIYVDSFKIRILILFGQKIRQIEGSSALLS